MTYSPPITVPEAAKLLGYGETHADIERLRRRIRAREKQIGKPILQKTGPLKYSRTYLTEPLLREHFPEHFNARDHVAETIAKEHEKMWSKLREMQSQVEAIAVLCAKLQHALASHVNED